MASCAGCRFCLRAACIWTFSGTTLQMPGSHWCAPIGLRVLTSRSGTWVWALPCSGIGILDSLGFMSRSAKRRKQVWEIHYVSPGTAPSKGAKLCTYRHWFGRPSNLRFEPYYELPMGIIISIALISVTSGAQFPGLFQDAAGCMRMFMWHRDQKSVCHCLIALLQKAQT